MDADELHIRVVDQAGGEHRLPALEGWTVMEIVRDAGLPLKAECGGALQCATCHVYVEPAWFDRLPPKREEEDERLDDAFSVQSTSRLSCQILMAPELDGLSVTLAPGTEP
jgi:2Fe-2S ferredoxin